MVESIMEETNSLDKPSSDEQNIKEIIAETNETATTQQNVVLKEEQKSQFDTNLERFRYICKDLPSPDIFIDLDFYFMISSCLARKVWIGDEGHIFRLYPNLYLIFVSPPGIGKSMPAHAAHYLLDTLTETKQDKKTKNYYVTKLLNLAPDAISYEKLIIRAHSASEIIKDTNGKPYHHSSTTFCIADELGLLFHDNTKRIVLFLNKGWDCHDFEDDYIKRGDLKIMNMCINFLGCAVPRFMRDLVSTNLLDDGFIARVLFVYGDKKRQNPTSIKNTKEQVFEGKIIQKHLRKLATLPASEIKYTPEAYEWLDNWTKTKLDKVINEHPKLAYYNSRRQPHLIKLAINIHYSESLLPFIEVEDLVRAESLLLKLEVNMHLALVGSGENPNYNVSLDILKFLQSKGPSTRQTIKIKFYSQADVDKLDSIMDFLINTEQCNAVAVNNKPGISLKLGK